MSNDNAGFTSLYGANIGTKDDVTLEQYNALRKLVHLKSVTKEPTEQEFDDTMSFLIYGPSGNGSKFREDWTIMHVAGEYWVIGKEFTSIGENETPAQWKKKINNVLNAWKCKEMHELWSL